MKAQLRGRGISPRRWTTRGWSIGALVAILLVCLVPGAAWAASSSIISFPLSESEGFNFQRGFQGRIGFLTAWTVGGTNLKPDLTLTDPTGASQKVVGVLSSYSWGTGRTDPMNLGVDVSTPNSQLLNALLLKGPTSNAETFSLTVWQYDPAARTWFRAVQSGDPANPLEGLIAKSGNTLALTVASLPNTAVLSPKNFAVTTSILPTAKAQEVSVSTSSTTSVMKPWGISQATGQLMLGVPADITAAATSSSGASVAYPAPTASDTSGATPAVSCDHASGSTFPIGTTTVTCTATASDAANSPLSASFSVTVRSSIALANVPSDISTAATSAAGAVVTYTRPTVVDYDSPPPAVSCDPAPGSTFPVGTTTVTCTASDSLATNGPASASFTVTVTPAAPAGLIGWWTLNDASGSNANDSSGAGNNGVISPGVAVGIPGVFGTAFGFSSASGDSWVDVPYGSGALAPPTTQITLSAWIDPSDLSCGQCAIASNEAPPGSNSWGYGIRLIDYFGPTLQFCWGTQDGPGDCAYGPYTPAFGTWANVVGTYDGSTLNEYVNGVLVASQPSFSPALNTTSDLFIGRLPSGDLPFNGGIQQVQVYDRVLSAAEVADQVQQGPVMGALCGQSGVGCNLSSGSTTDGGTYTSGLASPADPVQASITTPTGGSVTVQTTPVTEALPPGWSVSGQQLDITAPVATAAQPLRLVFDIDPSQFGSSSIGSLAVFRDGTRVPPCTATDGSAAPDPCVVSQTLLASGVGEIVVLSSHASLWNFGVSLDHTPPVVVVPVSFSVDATSPSGAVVTYTATATDDVDGTVAPSCSKQSGSLFPIGSTVVTCTAQDSHGNASANSFTVHVEGAAEQLDDLLQFVIQQRLGEGFNLPAHVAALTSSFATNQKPAFCFALRALGLAVKAQSGKGLTTATAAAVMADIARIEAVEGC